MKQSAIEYIFNWNNEQRADWIAEILHGESQVLAKRTGFFSITKEPWSVNQKTLMHALTHNSFAFDLSFSL